MENFLSNLAKENKDIKITFNKYCCSYYYGKKCKCKRCCEANNIKYNETEEHKNWVYANIMTGRSLIIENVKPIQSITNEEETYFYVGKPLSKED